MQQALQDRLRERHPELLCELLHNPPISPIGERGIEVGDGWFDLLEQTFAELERVSQVQGIPVPPLTQVKEKFGLLRFYVRGQFPEAVYDAIDEVRQRAVEASATICETCGGPGEKVTRHLGGIMVRCGGCT